MTKPADTRTRVAAAVAVLIGAIAIFGTIAAQDHQDGWGSAALGAVVIAVGIGVTLFLRRRGDEAGALLTGLSQDERQEGISHRAGHVTGIVACCASVAGYVISTFAGAHGQAQAFGLMATICGATLIVSTVLISRRS